MGKLSALGVKNAKPGRHGDGDGLYLLVSATGAKSWMIRVQRDGKRRDIGLGSLAALGLADARTKAADLRKHALNGRDPIEERDRDRRPTPTFKDAVKATHEALKAGWSDKTAADFLTSLETYANPVIGNLKVDTIEASHVRDLLAPIWTRVPETSRKVKVRISSVLNFAHSKGWRPTEAPRKSVTSTGWATSMAPGWTAGDLFGIYPHDDCDFQGLAVRLDGRRIVMRHGTRPRSSPSCCGIWAGDGPF